MKKLAMVSALAMGLMLLAAPAHAQNADAIVGNWTTQGGNSVISIFKCGEKYCGRIISLKEPNYPANDAEAGKPKRDRNNPDANKQNRPIIGLNLVWGFSHGGGNEWSGGNIYDPESGKTYYCTLTLESNNRLKVRGSLDRWGLAGRTVHWTR
jgi:uncharacterized protein (DUF2147 family)